MSFNLFSILPKEDKETITAYINQYSGVASEQLVTPLQNWLQYWGKAKIKLWKLLGKRLRYSFSIDSKDLSEYLTNSFLYKINNAINYDSFCHWWETYVICCVAPVLQQSKIRTKQDPLELIEAIKTKLLLPETLINNAFPYSCYFKDTKRNKSFSISENERPIRVINKILEFFTPDGEDPLSSYAYKVVQGDIKIVQNIHSDVLTHPRQMTITLSIHPLDFMTLSHSSTWSSCLNWTKQWEGCYKVGTIEMMNSNNVICAFVSTKPFSFDDKGFPDKSWRQLFYITPDILLGGKDYPYHSTVSTKAILTQLKDLAAKNLGWHYQYGIESYQDMIHSDRLEAKAAKIRKKYISKDVHSILIDTKGMYNDFLNDIETTYYCYRNYVPKSKIISVSGRTACLCCGNPIIRPNKKMKEYNERFLSTQHLVCKDCAEKYYCKECGQMTLSKKHDILFHAFTDKKKKICTDCYNDMTIYKCPDCGGAIVIDNNKAVSSILYSNNPSAQDNIAAIVLRDKRYSKDEYSYYLICCCFNCQQKLLKQNLIKEVIDKQYVWAGTTPPPDRYKISELQPYNKPIEETNEITVINSYSLKENTIK